MGSESSISSSICKWKEPIFHTKEEEICCCLCTDSSVSVLYVCGCYDRITAACCWDVPDRWELRIRSIREGSALKGCPFQVRLNQISFIGVQKMLGKTVYNRVDTLGRNLPLDCLTRTLTISCFYGMSLFVSARMHAPWQHVFKFLERGTVSVSLNFVDWERLVMVLWFL